MKVEVILKKKMKIVLNSCYSSLSDFVSEMRNSGICGEIRGTIKSLKR